MGDPRLERIGRVRALEAWLEGQLPGTLALVWWGALYFLLSAPAASRSWSPLEVALLLGAGVALNGWALSRLMFLPGVRRPMYFAVASMVAAVLAVLILDWGTSSRFEDRCVEVYGGTMVTPSLVAAATAPARPVCAVDRSPDSPYLGGSVLRPAWGGTADLGWRTLLFLGLSALAGGLAFRDRRVRRSHLAREMIESFALAPAAGLDAVHGEEGDGKAIVACDNPTLWGELCGQLYWEGAITAEDPCVRCGFSFHPGDTVTLRTVGVTQDRVDKLNVMERQFAPTEPWGQGSAGPTPQGITLAARGPARWQELGEFTLPRTLTVAQTLAIVCEKVEGGAAAGLVRAKASRISAWMWFLPGQSEFVPNLAVQPGMRTALVAATERLGDVLERHSGRPVLQLDIGLIPVQFRFGNRRATSDNLNQNLVMWLPVRSPHDKGPAAHTWVPRVESAALRTWLGVVRRSGEGEERMDMDVMPYVWPPGHQPGRWRDGAGRALGLRSPASEDALERLTMVRMAWGEGGEPVVNPHMGLLGARLDEWEWLDREQIEQLREGVVVALPHTFVRTHVSTMQLSAEEQAAEDRGGRAVS